MRLDGLYRLAVLSSMLTGLPGPGSSEPLSGDLWWQTERSLIESLQQADLFELVRSAEIREPSSDPAELLRRLQLFVRAGHREDAAALIPVLAECRARLSSQLLEQLAMFLLGREEWELARLALETFPTIEAGWDYTLLRHWRSQGRSVESIDAWMAKRQPANPGYWVKHRIRLRAENGTDEALIREIGADIRAHPSDPGRVYLYLDATSHREQSPEWLGDAFQPRRALDAYEVGSRLVDRAPEASVKLLELSLAMELTDAEVHEFDMHCQQSMPGAEAKKRLLGSFRHALVRAYQKTGRNDKAQKLAEELIPDSGDEPISSFTAQVAGQVQASSGSRVIERRILRAEGGQVDSPNYWLSRAYYYSGRRQHAEAVRAFERALMLAPIETKTRFKVPDARLLVLHGYLRHLVAMDGIEQADRLLHRELSEMPPYALTAERAVHDILWLDTDHNHPVRPDDPLLWRFLERRQAWAHTEERLVWKLLERTPIAKRESVLARAERLARGRDPSRARILGWVLTRMHESRRALPLLRDALARLKSEDDLASAAYTIFEAYLDTGDWRAAERTFPLASKRLNAQELGRQQARIALLAARRGAKGDALRIWKQACRLDPADLQKLDEMARAGMQKELAAHYRALAERDPKSWIPGRALEILMLLRDGE
ncbi:MAG: hypothetical protein JXR96_29265 [Deltaproteobacteria bacterium]|nr:hypothetical protein [Deltaproteobacteria bacterium]